MDDERFLIRSLGDLRSYLNADMQAHNVTSWRPWLRYKYPELHYQRVLRLVEFLASFQDPVRRLMWILARIRLAQLGHLYGLSVPPFTFEKGLSIAHIGNIVVNDKAQIGQNCRVHSGVNIGEASGAAPRIGNNVYLGPGAVLFGAIEIGDGAVIGANSVVTRDVSPGVVVAGAPAKVVREVGDSSPMPSWMTSPGSARFERNERP